MSTGYVSTGVSGPPGDLPSVRGADRLDVDASPVAVQLSRRGNGTATAPVRVMRELLERDRA